MRMNLVKDGLFEREYYFGRKNNNISYYKYRWSDTVQKYVPDYHETFKAFEGLEAFEEAMKEKGFDTVENVKAKGTYRPM